MAGARLDYWNAWIRRSWWRAAGGARKLRLALEIFRQEMVVPDLWVAPGHSFDNVTLQTLNELGIRYVSDGFSLCPYRDAQGMTWVPQQLWHFREMPFGLWTVCLHLNRWAQADVARFHSDLRRFAPALTDWQSVIAGYHYRKPTIAGSGLQWAYRMAFRTLKRVVS